MLYLCMFETDLPQSPLRQIKGLAVISVSWLHEMARPWPSWQPGWPLHDQCEFQYNHHTWGFAHNADTMKHIPGADTGAEVFALLGTSAAALVAAEGAVLSSRAAESSHKNKCDHTTSKAS